LLYKHTIIAASLIGVGVVSTSFVAKTSEVLVYSDDNAAKETFFNTAAVVDFVTTSVVGDLQDDVATDTTDQDKVTQNNVSDSANSEVVGAAPKQSGVRAVPFYSQFTDISAPQWRKVGCGIASLAMLIEYYEPNSVTVDELLQRGIDADAYLSDAGWTHSGLINLSHKYGLGGESHSLAGSSMEDAFAALKDELEEGPVMASVHYTFDPQNPIPHLVVVNGVRDGKVYYNDPSESGGGGSISIAKFQSSWKKRYIDIRPIS
jgi:uncharacterized protein YvpB